MSKRPQPLTVKQLSGMRYQANEILNGLERHMYATTEPRSKERQNFRVEVLKDAVYLFSSLEIILEEARSV